MNSPSSTSLCFPFKEMNIKAFKILYDSLSLNHFLRIYSSVGIKNLYKCFLAGFSIQTIHCVDFGQRVKDYHKLLIIQDVKLPKG